MNEQETIIYNRFCAAGIEISSEQATQFYRYFELLVEKNQVMNLTAITEFHDVVEKHFLDSAMLYLKHPELFSEKTELIDVGTGAGFPGLPLKIVAPECKLTLLDTLRKRVDFLSDVAEKLVLSGVQTIHSRAEDGAHDKMLREKFDIATARAVSRLAVLCEYCLPYVKVGGIFCAYKSQEIEDELNDAKKAIKTLGGEVEAVEEFTVPGSDLKRSLVIIRKKSATPAKYPRSAGKPERQPL